MIGLLIIGGAAIRDWMNCGTKSLQQDRITELENSLTQCGINLDKCLKDKEALAGLGGADLEAKNALIAALEADLEKKKAMIAQMQAQLLASGAPLPPELNIKLQEFAKTSDMITFDEATGSLNQERPVV